MGKTFNAEKQLAAAEYCPQKMLTVANSFFYAAEVCDDSWTPPTDERYKQLLIAIFVNRAVACEIFIKALLQNEHIPLTKEHNLKTLFDLLPLKIQAELKNCYAQMDSSIEDKLNLIADSFIEIRYAYEYSSLSIEPPFLESFARNLQEIAIRELGPKNKM